ncbi:hypothetical protein [Xenorhabdus sp. KJ12.1]|uniref:hypothetical protein n=1 Tax=Xenorhabdus sp. KJ12.1 TaxID=1851571 RepID=UPI000C05655B|nr:hypothetical protein [Xenorhabdus sp. KJ12.1]PHM67984.1 hypothetical protein Xekj_03707 [Xenorhabdus sp. KJ12.1]
MKKLPYLLSILLLTGCQQLNDISSQIKSVTNTSNDKVYDWEKGNQEKTTVTEKEVCELYRNNPEQAKKRFTGKTLIHRGDVQCVLNNPLSFSIGNVVSLPIENYMKDNVRLAVREGMYLNVRGKILTIENHGKNQPPSDCEIGIHLESMNQL